MKRFASIWISILFLQGCAMFAPPREQPVIEEKLNASILERAKVGTLSLTPERRVVLVNFANNRFCAEPPTEVGSDLSRLIQATAEANLPNDVKAKLGAMVAASSSNSVLNRRTQGMQLFLASSYFLCQMYMNGAIEAKDVIELQLSTFNAAAPLIEREIPLLYKEAAENEKRFKPLDIEKLLGDVIKNRPAGEPLPGAPAQ
jgi:hypothetical protein